ncbi:MAG: hypothetical protein AAGA77_12685 [Bacteroidota bacterium]
MGTWSHTILGNDTSCEVRERFIELYNSGLPCAEIKETILDEQSENIKLDPTNVWLGFALICWETQCLDQSLLNKVRQIIQSGEDTKIYLELEADTKFIAKREKELKKFLDKIQTKKAKPRRRVKPPKKYSFIISKGDIIKIAQEEEITILIVKSENTKNKGEIKYVNLSEIKSNDSTDYQILRIAELGQDWGELRYKGKAFSLTYDKTNKDSFIQLIESNFEKIRNEDKIDFDKMVFDSNWHYTNYDNHFELINLMKDRHKEDVNNSTNSISIKELIRTLNE